MLVLPSAITGTISSTTSSQTVQQAGITGAPFQYIVAIVLENHPMEGVGGVWQNASYLTWLATQSGYGAAAMRYHDASRSGSLPNYLSMISGNAPCKDTQPDLCHSSAKNLVDLLDDSGKTWKAFFEDYVQCNNDSSSCSLNHSPQGCNLSKYNSGYIVNHNPFLYYNDIVSNTTRCANILTANTPSSVSYDHQVTPDIFLNYLNQPSGWSNYNYFVPTHCDSMHGPFANWPCVTTDPTIPSCQSDNMTCWVTNQVKEGDDYLRQVVPQILNSKMFQTGQAVLFITFDEPNTNPQNPDYCPPDPTLPPGPHLPCYCPNPDPHPGPVSESCTIPGIWAGPNINACAECNGPPYNLYTHYSLLKTIEKAWNLPSLTRNDSIATPMSEFIKGFPDPPTVSFSFSPSDGRTGQPVQFTGNLVSGGVQPVTYYWDFGDKTNDTVLSPSHVFTAVGNYTVALSATDTWGQPSKTITHKIRIFDQLAGSFTYTPACVTKGSPVTFTATVSGGRPIPGGQPYVINWFFGDNFDNTASGSVVTHTYHPYAATANFTVSAIIHDYESSLAQTKIITVTPPCPVPTVDFTPVNPLPGTNVTFRGNAVNGTKPYAYLWEMDGVSLRGQTVTHKFAAGNYTIVLTVADTYGTKGKTTTTLVLAAPQLPPQGGNDGSGGGTQPPPHQGTQNNTSTTKKSNSGPNIMPYAIVGVAGVSIVLGTVLGLTRFRRRP